MSSVSKWRVYCVEHDQPFIVYSKTEPTSCAEGTIIPEKTVRLEKISSKITKIKTMNEGKFQVTSLPIDVPSNSVSQHYISFPMDLQLSEVKFMPKSEMVGDSFSFIISPDTPVGKLTQDVNISDTTFNVEPSVVLNELICKGVEVVLESSSNKKEDLGRIVSYNTENYTLTTEHHVTQNFSSSDSVKLNTYFIKDLIIAHDKEYYKFGSKGFGTQLIPANTPGLIVYKNNNNTSKKLFLELEYLHS